MNYSYHYINLILKAKNRFFFSDGNFEKHHSVPKHWFNLNKTKKDYDYTIVFLSTREHFIAHKLLSKMFPKNAKAQMALSRMSNTESKRIKYKVNSRCYEKFKKIFIEANIKLRKDPILDAKRRKVCRENCKNLWNISKNKIMKIRNSDLDRPRRKKCSEILKNKHANNEMPNFKENNKNLKHMTDKQKENRLQKQKEYINSSRGKKHLSLLWEKTKGKTAVILLDGSIKYVTSEEYNSEKNVKYFHPASKKGKELRKRFS